MAQWVPRTAWRVANLNKTYGAAYVGLQSTEAPVTGSFLSVTLTRPMAALFPGREESSRTNLIKQLAAKQIPFIDLRDEIPRRHEPIVATKSLPHVMALHPHDLLSGACREILPVDRNAILVVVADTERRAAAGFDALKRQGYCNIVLAHSDIVRNVCTTAENN
mgnify:CR=1 FL=1